MRLLISIFLLPFGAFAANWYAAPTGTEGGAGTLADPISIYRAITNTSPVVAGDTLWLRGGTYPAALTSRLSGTSGTPINVKPYAAERPIIECLATNITGIDIYGSNTFYYGIEVWCSVTPRGTARPPGIMIWGPGTRVANCIVHDCGLGIGLWEDASPSTVYGCILYNNGSSALNHGIYSHSGSAGNTIKDNIILNSSGFGIHCYSETADTLQNFWLEGNIAANNGFLNGVPEPNYLLGGTIPTIQGTMLRNVGYFSSGFQDNARIGYLTATENGSAAVVSNIFGRGTSQVNHWTNMTMVGNSWQGVSTFWNYNPTLTPGTYAWNSNAWVAAFSPFQINGGGLLSFAAWKIATGFDSASTFTNGVPVGTNVVVRANTYEVGRGNIAVYNWDLADNVSVDVSSVVPSGYAYMVRNAANYFGPVVKSGTYTGGSITLPMTNLTVAIPVNSSTAPVTSWLPETVDANEWAGVCWSPELGILCAVAGTGTSRVATSVDGITWVPHTAAEANYWVSVCWSPSLGLFCAVAANGTHQVMTSPDGINWTARTAGASSSWRNVVWSPELGVFCAVASFATTFATMTSSDGITWTASSSAPANPSGYIGVAWSPELGLFVAGGGDDACRVMTSTNGATWTPRTAATDDDWLSIAWSPDLHLFAATADTSNTGQNKRVMTSPDGIVWTSRVPPFGDWQAICWSPELRLFVAVSYSQADRVMWSADGITWTAGTSAEQNFWYNICWATGIGRFVAVSQDGTHRVQISANQYAPPATGPEFNSFVIQSTATTAALGGKGKLHGKGHH